MSAPRAEAHRAGAGAGRLAPPAAAMASALLYTGAFPPFDAYPLAWVALAPLLAALTRVRPLAGAGLGLLFSVLAGALLSPWLPGMIAEFFDVSAPLAALATCGVLLVSGVPYAGFGLLVAWSARRGAFNPALVAAGWGACEFARAYGVVENPWALLAHSQAPWLRIVQSADLFGAIGLGMLIAAVNGTLAGVLAPEFRSPRWAHQAIATFACFVAALVYGGARLDQDFGSGEPIAVALVQGAVEPERRFRREFRADNLERYLALTTLAARAEVDLILWPEFSVEFPLAAEPELRARIGRAAGESGAELLFGAPHFRHRLLVREELNSAFLVREGRIVDRYDKIRLMPFSETRPRWVPIGRDRYRPGLELRPLRSEAAALGVLLCSEAMHAPHVRRLVAAGAELLVNPSNDDWFRSRGAAEQQLAMAVFRAVENRRVVLRPSTSGRSAIVDAHGQVLALAPYGEPAVIQARVRRSRARTLYQRVADALPGPAAGLVLVSTLQPALFGRRDP